MATEVSYNRPDKFAENRDQFRFVGIKAGNPFRVGEDQEGNAVLGTQMAVIKLMEPPAHIDFDNPEHVKLIITDRDRGLVVPDFGLMANLRVSEVLITGETANLVLINDDRLTLREIGVDHIDFVHIQVPFSVEYIAQNQIGKVFAVAVEFALPPAEVKAGPDLEKVEALAAKLYAERVESDLPAADQPKWEDLDDAGKEGWRSAALEQIAAEEPVKAEGTAVPTNEGDTILPPATSDETQVLVEASLEELAEKLYTNYTDNHPTMHSNRFAGWRELTAAGKDEWIAKAKAQVDGKDLVDAADPAVDLSAKEPA